MFQAINEPPFKFWIYISNRTSKENSSHPVNRGSQTARNESALEVVTVYTNEHQAKRWSQRNAWRSLLLPKAVSQRTSRRTFLKFCLLKCQALVYVCLAMNKSWRSEIPFQSGVISWQIMWMWRRSSRSSVPLKWRTSRVQTDDMLAEWKVFTWAGQRVSGSVTGLYMCDCG